MKQIDTIIGVVGVATSVVIFIAQLSGVTAPYAYAYVLLPSGIAASIVGAHLVVCRLKVKFDGFLAASRYLARINSLRCVSSFTVRIQN